MLTLIIEGAPGRKGTKAALPVLPESCQGAVPAAKKGPRASALGAGTEGRGGPGLCPTPGFGRQGQGQGPGPGGVHRRGPALAVLHTHPGILGKALPVSGPQFPTLYKESAGPTEVKVIA